MQCRLVFHQVQELFFTTDLAAPVEVGTMLNGAALPLLGSLWKLSKTLWSPVRECIVANIPFLIPYSLFNSFITEVIELVVQEPFETKVSPL